MKIIFLLILWLVTIILTVYDKQASRGRKRKGRKVRVPERVFWTLAFLGGAIPEYITMRLIHHKTRHKSFMWGLPLVAILNILLFTATIFIL